MSLIDFILNLAGLLLWLNWRSVRLDPLTRATPATLAGTLRRAAPSRLKRWHFLAALAILIFVRAWFYREIGPAVNWAPKLDLEAVTLVFRASSFGQQLLYSVLSFLRIFLVFYFWLLALTVINQPSVDSDPLQRMLLLQLGRVGHWPRWLQTVLPALVVATLWLVLHPLLTHMGIIKSTQSVLNLIGQALLVGGGVYMSLKFLLPAFLLLHLITSYVYLGASSFWDFIGATSRNLLKPLNRLPLRFGKVDFAPLVVVILIVLLLHVLPVVLQVQLSRRDLTIWPP